MARAIQRTLGRLQAHLEAVHNLTPFSRRFSPHFIAHFWLHYPVAMDCQTQNFWLRVVGHTVLVPKWLFIAGRFKWCANWQIISSRRSLSRNRDLVHNFIKINVTFQKAASLSLLIWRAYQQFPVSISSQTVVIEKFSTWKPSSGYSLI